MNAEQPLTGISEHMHPSSSREKSKLQKEAEFQDAKSEMDRIFIEVEWYQARLEQLTQREAEASEIVATFPAKLSELEKKIRSAEELFMSPCSNC